MPLAVFGNADRACEPWEFKFPKGFPSSLALILPRHQCILGGFLAWLARGLILSLGLAPISLLRKD